MRKNIVEEPSKETILLLEAYILFAKNFERENKKIDS